MEIKYTIQGLLIYITIIAYLLALIAGIFRLKKTGSLFFIIGFLISYVSFAYRWVNVGRMSMQSVFEVSLCIGICAAFAYRWFKMAHTALQMMFEILLCVGLCVAFGYRLSKSVLITWGNLLQILACIGICVAFVCRWLNVRHVMLQPLFEVFLYIGMCVALRYRGPNLGHAPLQNLFEVFLFLGVLVYPISVFCSRVLRIGGKTADMFLGIIILFPAGFIFKAEPQALPPALQSWLFTPHVAVYMLSYIFMAKAAFHAVLQLIHRFPKPDQNLLFPEEATYRMVCTGFPLLTLGLVLGSVWGKQAWGDYWGWDPKELWSLASWLVYVGYLHFRYMFGKKYPRLNSIWVISGLVVIIITLLWVNLSRLFPGMHGYAMSL